jgi:hypothetical protein
MRCEYTQVTVYDLACDRCGTYLARPQEAIRFLYHPGDLALKDDSGLLCRSCWTGLQAWLGERGVENRCARCGQAVEHPVSLHIQRSGDPDGWQLCRLDAVDFLNRLRTVEPKLDPETFTLAGDWAL